MLADYKLPRITYFDDDTMEFVAVFYEGEETDKPERDDDGNLVGVVRYRRTAVVLKDLAEFAGFKDAQVQKSGDGVLVTLPYQLTEKELLAAMDKVLAADTTRTPIEARRVPSA